MISRGRRLDKNGRGYRWVLLGLVWLVYGMFGLASRSTAPLVTPITYELGLSGTQMGLVLGAWQATYVFVAVLAGVVLDRWGVRRAIFAGIIVVALSLALRSVVGGFGTLLPAVAILGVGGPLISIGAPKMVSEWFTGSDRGVAVGIYTTGPIVGSLVVLSATHPVVMPLAGSDWRMAFLLYGALACVVGLLWFVGSKNASGATAEAPVGPLVVLRRLIGVRDVQILLLMGICTLALIHGAGSWLPNLLEDGGSSPGMAGYLASLPLVTGLAAALLVPRITPPTRRGRVLSVCALMTAFLLLAIPHATGSSLLIVLGVFGLSSGAIMPLEMLLLMDSPAVRTWAMGSAAGMFFCAAEIGGVGGPFLIGALADITGSLSMGMYLLAGVSVMLALLARVGRFNKYASGDGSLPADTLGPPA